MKYYVVVYEDYDYYNIKGVFTNKENAEKCKKYEEKISSKYGGNVDIVEIENLDDGMDYDKKLLELEKEEHIEGQKRLDKIKENDLAEYNRIKEKYGL